uniref:GmrSD restriction endonucleases N-terminal domain-containing protein n=1 Tax=Eubacterium plexicaudatum ASF492 TaxID=1235802 RepID=N2A4T4_9FIRM
MKVSSPNKPVQTITNKIKREQILFTHKLQRPEGVWNNNQKSLLIDSLLRGYLINPTYTVLENGKQYVIDGVQRLYSIYTFINDGYRLSKNLEPIVIDEETYEIAGKKFSKLDEKVRDELSAAQLQVCEISDYTDKDVREMFRRLNSGKPLNTTQKMTPDMSDELSDAVLSIVLHPFFQKVLTPAQLKSSVDLSIAIEILMLSEISDKYDFGSFRKDDRQKFIQYYNERVDLEKIELIKQGLDRLDESIPEDVKINKTTISFICYGAYRIVKDNKSFEKFMESVNNFLENYDSNDEYKAFTQQGTSSSESVKGRLEYWRNIIREL